MPNPFRPTGGFANAAAHATNAGINAFQGAAQAAGTVNGNANLQQGMTDQTNSQAAKAQEMMMKQQDAQSAQLIIAQGQQAMQTQQLNTLQAIANAKTDSAEKEISGTAQLAKAISY
ncbi:hypothetical protein A7J50_5935 (plasmid) [Pseudomonas antarctica]|uniref:HrpA pilus formation protein n=1 Tax=Pseudomonas antarctica TaxID=219572 RepID=A0A172ZAE7_9PSED|nr:hypothetical protein [Pseudomonas antarctica]ANF89251.1 hypothetical protein A7J50_5935 [Pseudomonas antarctica]